MACRYHKVLCALMVTAPGMTVGLASQAHAAIIAPANAADAMLQEQEAVGDEDAVGATTVESSTATTLQIGITGFPGGDNNSHFGEAVIFVFQLPAQPAGTVTSAELAFSLLSKSGNSSSNRPQFNADLYGIGHSSSSTIGSAWMYEGAYGLDSNATAIQQAILNQPSPTSDSGSTPLGRVETSVAGSSALGAFIQAQYDDGAVGGDYVFLRLNRSNNNDTNVPRYFSVASSENTTNAPTLMLTAVPEPGTMLMLATGGLLMLRRRRRGC